MKVKFAGQSYTVEQRVTATDLKKMIASDKKRLGGQASELDSLVTMIDNKDKNIIQIDLGNDKQGKTCF